MSQAKHYQTAPEDRISLSHKLIYGLGAFVNNLLAAAMGGMVIVLNLGLGMNPALVGLLGALPRLTDALTDPLMGYISDNTRSRWGRRRPYIFIGAIASGLIFALLWQLPTGYSETFYFIFFLIGSIIFYLAYTAFATPWVALGYELTPDYHERTRLMGVQNFIGQLAYVASPWFLWIMTYDGFFEDQVSGAAGLAIIIAVVTIAIGVLPALFLKERFVDNTVALEAPAGGEAEAEKTSKGFVENMTAFFKGFGICLKSKDFQKLGVATFMVFNGFMLISSFQFYVIIYYVFGGDQTLGAEYAGYAGTLGAVATFIVVVFITWLGTKIGKRRAFFVATGVSILGYALKWICYNPDMPLLLLLPAPFLAFGLGGLFTLMPSMVADVVDLDEVSTFERREGMYGSIFWWVVKLGMAAALAGGGFLLNATGFDVALGGAQTEQTIFLMRLCDVVIPIIASLIAIWAVASYSITEEKAHEVRMELESRRGSLAAMDDEIKVVAPEITPAVKESVESLLAKMTLDQKIGQMLQPERQAISPEEVKAFHIGSVLSGGGSFPGDNTPAAWVQMNDAYWAASMEQDADHLAIPILYGIDAIHGNNNVRGATVFPHNIGLGATHDPDLIARIARITALEVLATGVEWTFAPTLAVSRDNRWGRTYESYSEDTGHVASYAGRFVKSMQGDLGADSVIACVKHWVGDGGTTDGIDQGDVDMTEIQLRDMHVNAYLPALSEGVLTLMASLSSWNGKKCHGNRYLLTELLKHKLGFQGFIVSDWDGADQLSDDYKTAITEAANAGIDMFMVSEKWKQCRQHLKEGAEQGDIPMERINDAVRRILSVKMAYGLFDRPRPSERPLSNHESYGSKEHRDVAREAVRKSLVLLKDSPDLLPVKKNAKILVSGKNADNRGHQCGGFTIAWQGTSGNSAIEGGTSIWEGIQDVASDAILSVDGSAADTGNFDVAIVVIGETPYAEGMGDIRTEGGLVAPGSQRRTGLTTADLQPYGNSLELAKLHPEDIATIRRITAKGIPVVAILISGRPLLIQPELDESSAFIAAWLPGSEGQGVADVLFGDYDFHGRLSFSWPANAEKSSSEATAMFPYGYGLNISNR
ncbi:MAG: MFS transporter [Calditrichia bacterium]